VPEARYILGLTIPTVGVKRKNGETSSKKHYKKRQQILGMRSLFHYHEKMILPQKCPAKNKISKTANLIY
jgi:hypothetical protein